MALDFQEISHDGVIKEIKDGKALVEILQKSSCVSCEVSGVCNASESSIKTVEVNVEKGEYNSGEKVDIVFTRNEGFTALFIGYLFPFILMMIVMVVLKITTDSDLIAGSSALGVLLPYYGLLYIFKNKIRSLFEFKLRSIH